MRAFPGDKDFFAFFWLPDSFAFGHLQALIQHDPEFASMTMVLEGESFSGVYSNNFDASGMFIGEGAEFSPWPNVFFNFFFEIFNLDSFTHTTDKAAGGVVGVMKTFDFHN